MGYCHNGSKCLNQEKIDYEQYNRDYEQYGDMCAKDDETRSRLNRNQLMNIVPLYSDTTVFAEAKRGRIKRRKSRISGYIETVVLTNVSFDGVSFNHIWVLLNDNLRHIPVGARIEFRARTYRYQRRNGSYSFGLKKIDSVKIKDFPSMNNWTMKRCPFQSVPIGMTNLQSYPSCRTESILSR